MPAPERNGDESPAAYRAFLDYVAMGSGGKGRSIRDLAAHYTAQGASESLADRPPTLKIKTIFGWSKKYEWDRRVTESDAAIIASEETARAAIRAQRRVALEEADWSEGLKLRQAVQSLLDELPKFLRRTVNRIERDGQITEVITLALSAGPGELARALELASKIQRLSVGEATEIHKLVETELGAFFDLLQHNLSPEEYARIVALASSAGADGRRSLPG